MLITDRHAPTTCFTTVARRNVAIARFCSEPLCNKMIILHFNPQTNSTHTVMGTLTSSPYPQYTIIAVGALALSGFLICIRHQDLTFHVTAAVSIDLCVDHSPPTPPPLRRGASYSTMYCIHDKTPPKITSIAKRPAHFGLQPRAPQPPLQVRLLIRGITNFASLNGVPKEKSS